MLAFKINVPYYDIIVDKKNNYHHEFFIAKDDGLYPTSISIMKDEVMNESLNRWWNQARSLRVNKQKLGKNSEALENANLMFRPSA